MILRSLVKTNILPTFYLVAFRENNSFYCNLKASGYIVYNKTLCPN